MRSKAEMRTMCCKWIDMTGALPKCEHGHYLCDWGGEPLVPPCGCTMEEKRATELSEGTRLGFYNIIARAAVNEARRSPGEWIAPFSQFGWDEVVYEDGMFLLGRNSGARGYQVGCDAQSEISLKAESVPALVFSWTLSADSDIMEERLSQVEIDEVIRLKARELAGILV